MHWFEDLIGAVCLFLIPAALLLIGHGILG